jgi:hypothetical protein
MIHSAELTDKLELTQDVSHQLNVDLDLRMSPALAEELSRLTHELNEPPGKIFAKAIALYRLAVDASKSGDRVVILDSGTGKIKTEIGGF